MKIIPKIQKYKKKFFSKYAKGLFNLKHLSNTKKLILFFVPAETDNISGGILSICTIFKEVSLLKKIHNANVISSFIPNLHKVDYTYSMFKNEMVIFNFSEIMERFTKLESLEVHIPDYMLPIFNKENPNMDLFCDWSKCIKYFKINILNQNDLLMPDLIHINNLRNICSNLSMTVAHEKYATLEKRIFYEMPLHLFSPWLTPTPYIKKTFFQKENIIVLSPDEIDRVPTGTKLSKIEIEEKLKKNLPEFEFITIQNMRYDTYKETISRAKFTITFGEGLDGYFIESIFSGSISFAVYNELFFKPNFKNLPTVYSSYDELFNIIISDIKKYDSNQKDYVSYNNELINIATEIYSYRRLKENVKQYYLGNIDFK